MICENLPQHLLEPHIIPYPSRLVKKIKQQKKKRLTNRHLRGIICESLDDSHQENAYYIMSVPPCQAKSSQTLLLPCFKIYGIIHTSKTNQTKETKNDYPLPILPLRHHLLLLRLRLRHRLSRLFIPLRKRQGQQ